MNYEELHQWLATHGGWKESIPTTNKTKDPATLLDTEEPVTMVVAQDGSSIQVRVSGTGARPEDNTYTIVGKPKLAAPKAAAGSTQPSSIRTDVTNGREVTQTTYPGGETTTKDVPASAAQTTTPGEAAVDQRKQQVQVERQRNSEKYGIPFDDIELREWLDAKDKEARATTVQERTLALNERKALEDSAHTKWSEQNTEKQQTETSGLANRRLTLEEQAAKDAANKPTMIEGKPYRAVKDAQGNVTGYEEIKVAGQNTPIPDLGQIKGELGNLVPEAMARRDKLTEIYNAGGMDRATYEKQAAQIMADANSRQVELNNLLTQQNSVQTLQSNQRGQSITESGTNTTFSSGALDRAMKHTLEPYAGGPGSGETSARAFQALLGLQSQYARANGGLSQTTPVQPTAFQKHVLTIDPSGSIKIETGAGGGSSDVGAGTDLSNIGSTMSQGNPMPAPPDPGGLVQDLQDQGDPDWMNALASAHQETMAGVA